MRLRRKPPSSLRRENQMPSLRRGDKPRRSFGVCRKRRAQKLQRRRAQAPRRPPGCGSESAVGEVPERPSSATGRERDSQKQMSNRNSKGAAKRTGEARFAAARGCGWGLWHKNDRRWIKHPMSERRREYQTRGEAAAAMVQMTAGRRDALTNYFRISVAPRRLVSHNVGTHAPRKEKL